MNDHQRKPRALLLLSPTLLLLLFLLLALQVAATGGPVPASMPAGSTLPESGIEDCVPLATLDASGPPTGTAGISVTFSASVTPPAATPPLTYTWQATDQQTVTNRHEFIVGDTVVFTWTDTGLKGITVTAVSSCSTELVFDLEITIEPPAPPCRPIEGLSITGPLTVALGTPTDFATTVSPPIAEVPITYVWEATEQPSETHSVGAISDTFAFTWTVAGPQTITVTVANSCTLPMSATFPLAVEAVPCKEIEDLRVSGPDAGAVGDIYEFAATVLPENASPPFTYVWEATGEDDPVTHTLETAYDALTFTWDVTGTKVVTVTVSNDCTEAISRTHELQIELRRLYLPVVLRRVLFDPYEPNDHPEEAYGPLESAKSYWGYFPEGDPDDYYLIEFTTLEPISAQLDVPPSLDLDLYVYDADLNMVAWSNVSGKGVDEALLFQPAAVTPYYLRIYPYAGSSETEIYTLKVEFD